MGSLLGRLTARLARAAIAVVAATIGCAGLGANEATFAASGGGALGAWTLRPNACLPRAPGLYRALDLYRRDPSQDTEVVIVTTPGDASIEAVLARVPNENRMVRFDRADCHQLESTLGPNGWRVNGVTVLAGTVTFDCERPGIGRLTGQGAISCF